MLIEAETIGQVGINVTKDRLAIVLIDGNVMFFKKCTKKNAKITHLGIYFKLSDREGRFI